MSRRPNSRYSLAMVTFRWMMFWGALDLIYLVIVAIKDLSAGQIPAYADLILAFETVTVYESYVPLLVAGLGAALYVSLGFSGVLLLMGRKSGKYLSYVQIAPRLVLVIPSFFPLIWILGFLPSPLAIYVGVVLMLLSESAKVVSLSRQS